MIRPLMFTYLLYYLMFLPLQALGEDYAVPNGGSPYRSLSDLKDNQILHLPTGVLVSKKQMLDTIAAARVIYIGETHDNIEAHRVQLEILKAVSDRFPGKVAVGMEMFRRSAQPVLDQWHRGQVPDKEFNNLFRQNWGGGYRLYLPITDFMKSSQIPIIGLKSSTDTEQMLREEGLNTPGLPTLDLTDPYHNAYSMSLFGANKDHAPEVLKPYQMLVLWEESMAQSVAEFLSNPEYADFKLVVLAGGFHVQYGYGIPKRAFRRVPHAYTIVLPHITQTPEELKDREMKVDPVSIPLYSADFVWAVSYVVEQDNGIKLGVMLQEKEDDGLWVTSVMESSNGKRLGIQKDDKIVSMDGSPITNIDDLRELLKTKSNGDAVTVRVRRGDEPHTLSGNLKGK
ncbi:MAG: PDZ domain-containing protein [Candidatus Nitronauta litoralis]|uniref:PDZ domain-containing protein n=1 Tax=Candidatus Nitronauta litoralis TaxID=2705533 RepID=A0A7T0FZ67_9BACT|nr:MAG: PDZ domain-containing protein [Candidatus Nitronauta litoralis]